MTLQLEGQNLGAKHKYLNELVSESKRENINFENVDLTESDIDNIVKIDIACKNRNVDYILKVLLCEDILYVSRVIKQCPWLIAEAKYKHIINPKYLQEVLYPQMTTKAAIKFMNYIKLNLKDSERVEQFYIYENDMKKAADWLPHCSPDFIISNFRKHIDHVDITLLRRLCQRTIEVLEIYMDITNNYHSKKKGLQATTFLLKSDPERYLCIVEKQPMYTYPKFNKSSTELLMKLDSSRIMNNFLKYYDHIDIKTFLKHLKKENIKRFLYNLFNEKSSCQRKFISFETLTSFLMAMPDVDRFETVKQILLDKIHLIDDKYPLPKSLRCTMNNLFNFTSTFKSHFIYDHYWYRFTPFEFALAEIKKSINNQTPPEELNSMFETLIVTASDSVKNLTTLIEYFCKNYNNADQKIKESFIEKILLKNFNKFDEETWKNLKHTFMDDIFDEINETKYHENHIQICVQAIIVYETLHMRKVPDEVEDRFKFNSLKCYDTKLTKEESSKLFIYLYNTIMKKLNHHLTSTKEEFLEKTELLDIALNLLSDWTKELSDYPAVLNAIRDLIKINEQNLWKVDFSKIYNKKKSWRRVLFNDSLVMHPSQPVLINILKHDPHLLEHSPTKVESLIFNKDISLQQYHKKVKIYWSESMSKQLVNAYKNQLKSGNCNKAIIRGLCTLLTKEDLGDIITEYTPKEEIINWDNIDELTLNIQQNLAKTMHFARPQPTPKFIIDYSKGDYLPYALPSLYSIFYNLNLEQAQKFIPILLDTKVSLQKHGIRLAFIKLLPEDVKNLLNNVLRSNKNITIRHIAFTSTYKLLCKEKDPKKIQTIWPIMDTFLDDLTYKENNAIYDLLSEVKQLPISVQANYFMKAYSFLKGLIESSPEYEKYRYSFDNLISYAREIIEKLCPNFVEKILLEYINDEFTNANKSDNNKLELLSSYLICSKTKESQIKKCQDVLIPLLHQCFLHWNDMDKAKNYFIRVSLDCFLNCLRRDTKIFVSDKNMIIPTELFKIIQSELVKSLDPSCSYLLVTTWQLTVTFVEFFDSYKEDGDDWDKTSSRLVPTFSKACIDCLKDHCSKYFSNIYVLFAKALHTCLKTFISENTVFEIIKNMIRDEKSIEVHLVVLKLMKTLHSGDSDEFVGRIEELFTAIGRHPSPEVQIHYYHCRNVYLSNITESNVCKYMQQSVLMNQQK